MTDTIMRIVFFTGLLLLSGGLTQADSGDLRISGASTIQPILEELAPQYQARYGGSLIISAGGSGTGIRQALEGVSDVGMVSRSLRPEEQAQLQYVTIGLDTLVIIVNAKNPLTAMNRELLARMYAGDVRHWKDITDYDRPIVLINKEIGRATLDLFEAYAGLVHASRSGGGRQILREAIEIGSNLESLALVGGLSGAIGYVSMGEAQNMIQAGMPVKILTLDGVEASSSTVIAGRYPIRRELNLVFSQRSSAVGHLLELLQSSEGQTALTTRGFLPIKP